VSSGAAPAKGRRRVAWPVALWPVADRAAWEGAQHPGDLLSDSGAAAQWRPATSKSLVGAYGRWLAYLADHGEVDPAATPTARMTPETIRAYVHYLQQNCASVTVASYIGVLSMMVQAMVPDQDWRWLRSMQARLQRVAKPMRNKRPRIVPAGELLQLGLDLMAGATAGEANQQPPCNEDARDFRDGLMIAWLATQPLRQRNFLMIEIGRQLIQTTSGYELVFTAEETKNHRPLELPLPPALVPALERYLVAYRPMLIGMQGPRDPAHPFRPPGAYLWISQCGMPFTTGALQKTLARHTLARFGHIVNTHLFRDCAATTVASVDPTHVRIAAALLGHASFRTTERHYIVADMQSAGQRYHALITSIRADARRRNCRTSKDSDE